MTAVSPADLSAVRSEPAAASPPRVRQFDGGVNWTGLRTLYGKEVRRFWKVGMQTVAAPVVTTLLYMMVFVVAMGGRRVVEGVSFAQFVGPGLIMMAVLNNSFANASSSLIQAKLMGTAPDFLTPPLSPGELMAAFTFGAMTRGVLVGLVTAASVWPFSHFGIVQPLALVWFAFAASVVMALVGLLTGLWSEKFDHLAAVTNFIVMPMTFLSGTFYSVSFLPEPFRTASRFNPFFYMIDGFRAGFIGHADGSLLIGFAYTAALALGLSGLTYALLRSGWRLKS